MTTGIGAAVDGMYAVVVNEPFGPVIWSVFVV
jgi:hypothetical protein